MQPCAGRLITETEEPFMKSKIATISAALAVLSLVGATSAYCANCDDASQKDKQICCSAKNCTGKVLSNRDQHNCKDKSTGKSWRPANPPGGACVNL
jgi:hypothetical protein